MSFPLHSPALYTSQVLGLSPLWKLPASQAPRFACLPGWPSEHTCEFKWRGSKGLPELSPFPLPAWLSSFLAWIADSLLLRTCWSLWRSVLCAQKPNSELLLGTCFCSNCPRPSANCSVATNFKSVTSYRTQSSGA